ncbi:MAG: C4-dicarboxylate ABC transporter [Rhodoferax ferrireducens]|uniref:C4-dicarboxylate ABC transporter n=2 Tax=Pseudomonadota TaxID=1224 RepID=A0A1Y1QZQ5_9GAMM|nr:MAG: C4-dicarboxylate ABC transporter [Rhodoferax ferrireducens]OQX17228.1 MAG: C4-dicarboxylate ABC transporter [Thiothrix lacustris]
MNATTAPAAAPAAAHGRLEHMPVSMFSIVMGLAGTTIALEKAEHLWAWQVSPSVVMLTLTALVFVAISLAYLAKFVLHRQHVVAEFNHPIRLSFFPAMSIGMLLLAIAFMSHAPGVSLVLWAVGATVQLLFTLAILSNWMHHEKYQVQHSNPAWFIPIVGNILVPIAGVPLGFQEVSWFYFSVGLMMWTPLLAVLFNRFFFHPMIPTKLLPTLFILIAPPAVGFISWVKLHNGVVDDAARIFYYFGLFITLLLLSQFRYFWKLSFALPWWAYSFPMAAMTIATSVMLEKVGGTFFATLFPVLLTVLVLLVSMISVRTVIAMKRGQICVPE